HRPRDRARRAAQRRAAPAPPRHRRPLPGASDARVRDRHPDAPPMIRLYYAPRTRAVRVRWLLEELGVPHELARVEFNRPSHTFAQSTPLGKLPVIEDGDTTIGESGAIVEYILERYGNGNLAPPIGSPLRGEFLQWVHFAEATAFPPIGVIVWHTLYEQNADRFPEVMQ